MKNILNKKLAALLLLVYGFMLNAQTPPTPDEGTEAGDIGGMRQPIDDYIGILMVAGVVLIALIMLSKRKKISNI
ncbi:MAG: hypothetical protein QM564_04645 [Bergeyella sp.]